MTMMNDDMREEYGDILRRVLDAIPPEVFEVLTDRELLLFFQGLGEIDPRTILLPAVKEAITQYRPIPVEPYRPRN
jgi:hypothetical protein